MPKEKKKQKKATLKTVSEREKNINANSIVMLLVEKLFECGKIKSLISIDVLFCSLFLAGEVLDLS